LQPLCEGFERGGSSVEEGAEQPARVPSGLYLVVVEWMAAITGDSVGYFGIFGIFLCREKFWTTVFHMVEMETPNCNVFLY
jgi:hypothetical protein